MRAVVPDFAVPIIMADGSCRCVPALHPMWFEHVGLSPGSIQESDGGTIKWIN